MELQFILINKYDQLQLILDEISLIGGKILKNIDLWLRLIKHTHTKFFENLYVIITTNFHQVYLVHDAKVFKILQTTLIV
jgi:hypothetical protein